MTVAGAPLIWRVFSARDNKADTVLVKAAARGWEVATAQCVYVASSSGRRTCLLERNDASRLYEDMHRHPVAVIYDGKPLVRTYPKPPLQDRGTIPLFQFVRYKCFAMSLDNGVNRDWESAFCEWLDNADCEGRSDPRILPFHIFKTKGAFDLDDPPSRRRFRQSHKKRGGTTLVDKRKRRWSPPRSGASHGREPQTVRRVRLDDGFHWDVTTPGSPYIASANTIWKLPPGAYINIYPDGYIRSGRRCRQVWTYRQSARADAQERD